MKELLMSSSLESVEAQALKLSEEERVALIEKLAATLSPAPALPTEWDAEIARRVAEMDAGRTRFVPADAAMEELAAYLDKARPSK
ncbi:addiction module protein [Piscinibacter sakaiensis]|uniref:addiction module protein n=1 Tax=Piscinibacter sakaiensis TaxID=1547922 RepID=UPI003AB05AD8